MVRPDFPPHRQVVPIGGHHLQIFANDDIAHPHRHHTGAIIIIHGRRGEAAASLALMQLISGETEAPRLIIAPHFMGAADAATAASPATILHWPDAGWMAGEAANGPSGIGSFAALDAILAMLSDRTRYPALAHITLAGHSAGGQLVQRYAVMANLASCPVPVRFIAANPSSYVYLDSTRIIEGIMQVPPEKSYPGFDDWKFGLSNRPDFGVELSAAALAARYAQRQVIYLLGEADNNPADAGLDRRPAASAQGGNRLARGQNYWRYLNLKFGGELNHRLLVIPATGHDQEKMFNNKPAIAAVFEI